MLFLDLIAIVAEYFTKKNFMLYPKLWAIINTIALLNLGIVYFVPQLLISLLVISINIGIIILLEMFIHYQEAKAPEKFANMKLTTVNGFNTRSFFH